MIRVRTTNNNKLVTPRPLVTIEPNNRLIATENDKRKAMKDCSKISIMCKNKIKSLWDQRKPLFRIIAIETSSRCNLDCGFCPVNKNRDVRPFKLLSMNIINKIATELRDLRYSYTILLFGNNEPLLDPRMHSIIKLFRCYCPSAYIKICTNGTLISPEIVSSLFLNGLSTLVINNYTELSQINDPVQEIIDGAEMFGCHDVRIVLRDSKETLTNRAGQLETKTNDSNKYSDIFCCMPFVDLQIRYNGEVGICCFDALGETTLGQVAHSSLRDIWFGEKFCLIRNNFFETYRRDLYPCNKCDFDGFRDFYQDWAMPLLREDMLDESV